MKYSLTERQKDMLRSIAPGLEDGTISSQWIYWAGGGQIESILSINGKDGHKRIEWQDVTESDFEDFVENDLFRHSSKGGYGPVVQKIIYAVKNNFK